VNSSTIDDYDRQLSPKGRKVAHVVGTSLHKKRVDIPDVILASPSVRTRETLDIVLTAAAWERKQFFVDDSKILYSKSWYDLSDEGYLNHLVHIMLSDEEEDIINKDETDHGSSIDTNNTLPNHKNIFSNVNIIMIVGHNPAIERLLNDLLVSPNDTVKQWNEFSPGHFYALRFHQLERWGDFGAYIEGGGRGVVELHLPG
jgi:phosphohistidine phosphatase SixA